jgi:hypothetical protein
MSIPKKAPESCQYMDRIPDREYNYSHTVVQKAAVPMSIVLWNMLDFSHVNWMHRKCYHHCKVLAEMGNVHLLEYGVNQFFFLKIPFTLTYTMWHEFAPPNVVRHISRGVSGYTKVEVVLKEEKVGSEVYTTLHHTFFMRMPKLLKPLLVPIMDWYVEYWSKILWEEDSSMLYRRKKVLDVGFVDHPADLEYKGAEGFASKRVRMKVTSPST